MLQDITLGVALGETWRWHNDFAHAHAHYIEKKHAVKVRYAPTIDELIEQADTKYVLIQDVTQIITDWESLLSQLEQFASNNIVVGYSARGEYARLQDNLLFINKELWDAAGKPKYRGEQGTGAELLPVRDGGFERSGNTTMIMRIDAECGARLIEAQVRLHGAYFNLPALLEPECTFHFRRDSPYHEIHFETMYEDLQKIPPTIYVSPFEMDVEDGKADVLISNCDGLQAVMLAQHYNVKKVILIDKDQAGLDFQKFLFSIEKPHLFGDIVASFVEETGVHIKGNWTDEEYVVVPKLDVEVETKLVNVVSWQMEMFLRELELQSHVVVNLDDIYLLPSNYYKRTLRHGMAMFKEQWSLMASRVGPTRFVGWDAYGKYYNGEIINGNTTVGAHTV